MFRRSFLLLYLLVASMMATATVHAQESSVAPVIECSGIVHADGDADQSRGDPDKGMAGHHSVCHGSAAVFRDALFAGVFPVMRGLSKPAPEAVVLPRWTTGPLLRPPIA
ncbi:hypothetical protein A8V01_16575 [Novosphingobium guangzhouense]|uniref:DUF2946 domain-containing protein n=1 Tax=Novosphingobium guangzhouense TaxID=1850347 RepID=A0A2K2G2Y8_9SPHN|nr:hypothetical protein A8V01_16575 [Novosphingobium guangzhouense]